MKTDVTSAGRRMRVIRTGGIDDRIEQVVLRAELMARVPAAASAPEAIRTVRAPGRVNLIGEHTDYNEGFVLPVAIDRELRIAFVPTNDRRVELTSLATGKLDAFELDAIGPPTGDWIDYVAGVAKMLTQAGVRVRGLRGVLASMLPIGAGLSSSAALELGAAWALTELPGGGIDGLTLARLAQQAENAYVGVGCGLMDQVASALGQSDAALLVDCRTLEHRPVVLPLHDHRIVVCDTGVRRRLDMSAYNARRAQCDRAVRVIAQRQPTVRALRDVDLAMLAEVHDALDPESIRRCQHVITENARVLDCVTALEAGDLAAVGRLFADSHASLRDCYEVSSPELDALVDIAVRTPGVVGARLTGAGFGGCIVAIAAIDAVAALEDEVMSKYPARTGRTPRVWVVAPAAGAGVLEN